MTQRTVSLKKGAWAQSAISTVGLQSSDRKYQLHTPELKGLLPTFERSARPVRVDPVAAFRDFDRPKRREMELLKPTHRLRKSPDEWAQERLMDARLVGKLSSSDHTHWSKVERVALARSTAARVCQAAGPMRPAALRSASAPRHCECSGAGEMPHLDRASGRSRKHYSWTSPTTRESVSANCCPARLPQPLGTRASAPD
jgi:hypothetical protein